jgi:hypothetical protein
VQSDKERLERLTLVPLGANRSFILQLEDASSGDYWLHLEIAGSTPLWSLDEYLRAIWLECCGHMSKFVIGDPWRGKELPANARAAQLPGQGMAVTHVYDVGTSSYTKITSVLSRSGCPLTRHPILLMARNDPPDLSCMDCGRPAVVLCMECVMEEDRDGGLCDSHASGHPHEAYGEPPPRSEFAAIGNVRIHRARRATILMELCCGAAESPEPRRAPRGNRRAATADNTRFTPRGACAPLAAIISRGSTVENLPRCQCHPGRSEHRGNSPAGPVAASHRPSCQDSIE